MDGAIAVVETPSGTVARCKILRDLEVGEQVVVGVEGIRTVRKTESREQRNSSQEFSFMGAGVSSERRVELVVEQIAWELRQIRDRGGKVAVTAGPVVIHTGGSHHLARLIREGYVQVLLGGNAIAVHDIEQSLMGTSLGVDMKKGVPVRGGHRHHLKTINAIRRCGSIASAVDRGIVTKGVMYECIKHDVPFCLAGSIRDDGPLPDTEMDLIQAQAKYAQLLEGTDMTNDPFSPPELEWRADKATVRRISPFEDELVASNSRLVFDQGLSLPFINRWVFDRRDREQGLFNIGFDDDERGGLFIERTFTLVRNERVLFQLTPQYFVQRALTDSNAADPNVFGLRGRLNIKFSDDTFLDANASLTSFDFGDIENQLRANAISTLGAPVD